MLLWLHLSCFCFKFHFFFLRNEPYRVIPFSINFLISTFTGYALSSRDFYSCVGSELECGLRCLRDERCRSYNCLMTNHHNNGQSCRLNWETRSSKPGNYEKNNNWAYYELLQVCHQWSDSVLVREKEKCPSIQETNKGAHTICMNSLARSTFAQNVNRSFCRPKRALVHITKLSILEEEQGRSGQNSVQFGSTCWAFHVQPLCCRFNQADK